ncbi:response regulator [Rhodanobacter sp. DHB23]|uniref:response regulator n=1 Tax=Rhodanobacter sp. DHB23 TaxID=2775923 RepID=UPI00177A7828|nr:response regulator [Rhodanobacter sp. DHB23]MBD8873237.1 response regulator [Rhodanobacter sp. DHB23]
MPATTRTKHRKYSWLANQPIQRKIQLAIVLLLGVSLGANLLTLDSLRQQDVARHWYVHTYAVLQQIDEITHAAKTAQVGIRGYLLDQRADERSSYLASMQEYPGLAQQLRKLTADNPLQQARIDRLDNLMAQWRQEVNVGMLAPLQRLETLDPAQQVTERQRIQADYIEHRSVRADNILAQLDLMSADERDLLSSRTARLDSLMTRTRVTDGAFTLLMLLLGMMVISLCFRLITRPLRRITDQMSRLAAHDHSVEIRQVERRDEIGEIARALQVFKEMAIETHDNARLKGQVTAISRQLQETTTHRAYAERLTSELMPLLKAGVGLFYLHDEPSGRLDLIGSYGLRLGADPAVRYLPGEGLVGQCALSRQPIELDHLPDDYLRIDSGSGSALPRHLSIRPVLLRDRLIGVLEFAGFEAPAALHRQLLEQLLPMVALSLDNLGRAVRTQDLLEQTQEQADQLHVGSITMRQQQAALRESHDILQAKTMELEEQSQRLLASEEELRVQAEELQASNEELRLQSDTLYEQKQTLVALQADTAEKARELARASQYKSEFLANMSHELRTPLNSLLILSRSLAENAGHRLDAEEVESAQIIHDAGSSLLRLINDILDLSKIEAGKMELALDDYALEDLARSLRRNFDHVARDKGLGFDVQLVDGLPAHIHTDPGKLEQIVNNLLANAFKFTAAGSVQVRIGHPAADLTLPVSLEDQPLLAISVTDTGIGIPADKLEKVFAAFEQVDSSTSRHYGGTGLGLSISRRMAALLGGDIALRSESGRGSEFTLLLPERSVAAPAAAAEPAAPSPMRPLPNPALRPGNLPDDRERLAPGEASILIVEDDPAFARILADMVRQKGYPMLLANDGESGLELARRYRPLGILLDVMLPGIDGWTVAERLQADPATRSIPVHFLSAADDAAHGRELGAAGFLTKPVSREQINAAVDRLLHAAHDRMRRVLVVEDDAAERSALRNLLRQDRVEIDEAGSAEQALEQIARNAYDCVVLDLGLPGLSGMELLERLGADGSVPPVVIYSGRDLSREENLRIRQYTDSIVIKGVRSPDRLLDEVSLFLHRIRQQPSASTATVADGLEGHQLLLVDDDMRNLFALSKVLRGWGLKVSMAQDGPRALRMLEEEDALELVLMDIMMPGMDGYEAIRQIRAQPRFAQLPIIALTAKAMRGDREQCLAAGANDYLSKPVDLDKLNAMIRVWLRR